MLLLAVSLILVPTAAAGNQSGTGVSCPDSISAGQQAQVGGEPVAYAEVESNDDCGAYYDPSSNQVSINPSISSFQIHVRDVLLGVAGDYSDDDLAQGVDHNGDWAQRTAYDQAPAPEDLGLDGKPVWMDTDGVHLNVDGVHAVTVPWPVVLGHQVADHENVYIPTEMHTSSDELAASAVDTVTSKTGAAPAGIDSRLPLDVVPTVTIDYRIDRIQVGNVDVWLGAVPPPDVDGPTHTTGLRTGLATDATVHEAQDRPSAQGDTVAAQLGDSTVQPARDPLAVTVAVLAAATILAGIAGYRRLTSGKVLDNTIRSRIFDYIKDNPGVTTQELADALEVDYSTANHHVSVLKEFDLVHSRRKGRITHYFENHGTYGNFEKDAIPLLREGTSAHVARLVRDNPGIKASGVARKLDVDPSTVKWHLDKLRDADLVDAEPIDGRSQGLVVPETARDVVDRWT